MESPDVLNQICAGRFFDELEAAISEARAEALLPWLDLLTTESIEDWAVSSHSLKKTLSGRRVDGQPALGLLLKRKLVRLGTRRDPSPLCSFCEWAKIDQLNPTWESLAETLEPSSVADQERMFTERIDAALAESGRSLGQIHWATKELKRLANSRCEPATMPTARVVFAATRRPIDPLRPGLLVDFALLGFAETGPVLPNPEFFDDGFLKTVERIGWLVGESQRRCLEHSCKIPLHSLRGSSGGMALWVAHRLASPGDHFSGRPWSLPPWIVISAELGAGPDAFAAPVEYTSEKAAVLEEEGVRLFLIGEGSNVPFQDVEDLQIRPFHENADGLARRLYEEGQLLKGDFSALETQLITPHPDAKERDSRTRERRTARKPKDPDQVRLRLAPTYAFQRIAGALARMDQGYLLIQAPSGHGKSELAYALADGEHRREFASLGKAIVFHVLRGEPTRRKFFFDFIARKAEDLDDLDILNIERAKGDPHVLVARRRIKQMLADTREVVCGDDEPLLLIVDGIDELDREAGPILLEMLPDADDLPTGCFVVLLSQDEEPDHVNKAIKRIEDESGPGRFHVLEFKPDDADYQALLREYANRRLGEACELVLPRMLTATTSFRQFDLLCRWLELLRDRGVDWASLDLSDFPEADEVFVRYLSELRLAVGAAHFDEWERRILILIAAAYEPIDHECLAYWLQGLSADPVEVQHQIELAIDRLRPLLRVERRPWLENRTQFGLADPQFETWLHTNNDPDWGEDIYVECLERVIEAGRRVFRRAQLSELAEQRAVHVVHYHFWYLSSMMIELHDYQAAYRFLTEPWQDEIFEKFTLLGRSQIFGSQHIAQTSQRAADFSVLVKHFGDAFGEEIGEEEDYPIDEITACIRGASSALLKLTEALVRDGRVDEAKSRIAFLEETLNLAAFHDGERTIIHDLMMAQPATGKLAYFHLLAQTLLANAEIALVEGDEERAYKHVLRAFAFMLASAELADEDDCKEIDTVRIFVIWSRISRLQTELCSRVSDWMQDFFCSAQLVQTIQRFLAPNGGLQAPSRVDKQVGTLLARALDDRASALLFLAKHRSEIESQFEEHQLTSLIENTAEQSHPLEHAIRLCGESLDLLSASPTEFAAKGHARMTRGRCHRMAGSMERFEEDFREAIHLMQQATITDSLSHLADVLECYREVVDHCGLHASNERGIPLLFEATATIQAMLDVAQELPASPRIAHGRRVIALMNWLDEAIHKSRSLSLAVAQVGQWEETKELIMEMAGAE